MDVGQSVAGCVVRVIRRLGRFFEDFLELREGGVRTITLLGTRVNKPRKSVQSVVR
jgi:hypothetical protein